jgi:hypothetical protein
MIAVLSERPFSPWGEGAPSSRRPAFGEAGRMRGPLPATYEVAPHQFGRMTYGCAIEVVHAVEWRCAAVSHGLTSSPPRGEGNHSAREIASC